jgi:hypothetical protein
MTTIAAVVGKRAQCGRVGARHIGLGGPQLCALPHRPKCRCRGRAGSAVAKEISSPDDNGRLIFRPVKRGTMCRRGRRWLR